MKFTFKIFLLILLNLILQSTNFTAAIKTRIVGGRSTAIQRAKYIVALRKANGEFFCAGSLVHPRFVVTAAHCLQGMTASEIYVHGGITYLTEMGIRRPVRAVIRPSWFNIKTVNWDVAVLQLSQDMQGPNISTIPLCRGMLRGGDWVQVFGWGYTADNANGPSTVLRTANVRIISRRQCQRLYRTEGRITPTQMCADLPGQADTCNGDSGGPLVRNGQLCGIVSFGMRCAQSQFPGVYTVINSVKDFILNAIRR